MRVVNYNNGDIRKRNKTREFSLRQLEKKQKTGKLKCNDYALRQRLAKKELNFSDKYLGFNAAGVMVMYDL